MNLNKNYYALLGVVNTSTEREIKKAYYKLSFIHHPDKNGDPIVFGDLTEAYDILCGEQRESYDMKSRFGNNYNEYYELLETDFNFNFDDTKDKLEKFKKNDVFNIYIKVDDTFDGKIEYERWVMCKTCDGSGKDLSSKIIIKDNDGKVLHIFDADDGCDFCEGSGKDYTGNKCSFCHGKGKVGLTPCKTCKGDKRILGKQKLKNIKLTGDETKLEAMGHYSKDEAGKIGFLILFKTNKEQSSE